MRQVRAGGAIFTQRIADHFFPVKRLCTLISIKALLKRRGNPGGPYMCDRCTNKAIAPEGPLADTAMDSLQRVIPFGSFQARLLLSFYGNGEVFGCIGRGD